jgi:small subunit ribosomal protein S20
VLTEFVRKWEEKSLAQRHKSAIKRHRQSETRAARNQVVRTHVRRVVRELRETIASKDAAKAATLLQTAMKTVDKAVTKGVLHRNNAARRISRLSHQVAALKAS